MGYIDNLYIGGYYYFMPTRKQFAVILITIGVLLILFFLFQYFKPRIYQIPTGANYIISPLPNPSASLSATPTISITGTR